MSVRDFFGLPRTNSQPSEVYVRGTNASASFGSAFTYIPRYVTTVKNTGFAIKYKDDAVEGCSFRIKESGVYSMRVAALPDADASSQGPGVSVNADAASCAGAVDAIASGTHFGATVSQWTNNSAFFNVVTALQAGDIVRPHYSARPGTTLQPTFQYFHIIKVG